jgi:hypothetical protein
MEHEVSVEWRAADAVAAEERAKSIGYWLEHTNDLLLMFKDDEVISSELRGLSGRLRSKVNDFTTKAETIRIDLTD